MRSTLGGTYPTLREYIQERMADARETGNSTCTLFAKDEKALERELGEMNLDYITPRRGQYIIAV